MLIALLSGSGDGPPLYFFTVATMWFNARSGAATPPISPLTQEERESGGRSMLRPVTYRVAGQESKSDPFILRWRHRHTLCFSCTLLGECQNDALWQKRQTGPQRRGATKRAIGKAALLEA